MKVHEINLMNVKNKPKITPLSNMFLLEYVEQVSTYVVIDCLDRTGKWSTGNLRWRKIKGTQAENIANSYCSTIDILPESSISKYKKGSPTEDDFRAFNTLRINEQSLE